LQSGDGRHGKEEIGDVNARLTWSVALLALGLTAKPIAFNVWLIRCLIVTGRIISVRFCEGMGVWQ
jgi:hypothetical protein